MMPATRGPYRSRIVPTASAETLHVVDAMAKKTFNLWKSLIRIKRFLPARHLQFLPLQEEEHVPEILFVAHFDIQL